jgi:uncharacterized protein (UPF0218 family)
MLFAPLNSKVIYGLKDKGAVIATVSEDLKKEITKIISRWKNKETR